MKAIMLMFDSLNRHMLPPYNPDTFVHAPNFTRLAQKTAMFENSYVASMPCMPARRDLHTGRCNFLHRSWGPLEPFDDSMPELLKQHGVYTHLITDHQHYFEDGGGGTYHNRYNSWEFMRGQEGDRWKAHVNTDEPDPESPGKQSPLIRQDKINRTYMQKEADMPQAKTFNAALEFLDVNHQADNWFLQVETFDPHEPFFAAERFRELYPLENAEFDWPAYNVVTESPELVRDCRYAYAALVSMCDAYLGLVLDKLDALDLWDDTLLIVNTDHGFLLGEKNWWAKMVQPMYNEVARTPLFIWDPRCGVKNERRSALVQTIDLAPSLLEFFGVPLPESMQGKVLADAVARDEGAREALMFGQHGSHVNVTDGRFVYMRAPDAMNAPLFNYTLMPTHMRARFSVDELRDATLAPAFSFTKDCPLLKTQAKANVNMYLYGSLLFDLASDPQQEQPLVDAEVELRMITLLCKLMAENDAPAEQYERLGLPVDGVPDAKHLRCHERRDGKVDVIERSNVHWADSANGLYHALLTALPDEQTRQLQTNFTQYVHTNKLTRVQNDDVVSFFTSLLPASQHAVVHYFARIAEQAGRR